MTAADILGGVLRMNLAAGAAILVVMALRKPFRPRFGARLAYGLWLLPVLAAAAVVSPARQVVIVRSAASALATVSRVHPAFLAGPSKAATSLDPLGLLLGLWIVGALGAALVMVLLQRRFMSHARAGAVGPAVVGVIAPRILTPRDFAQRYNPAEQALVLAHEQAHIARQDSRLNGLCAAAQCLCWFNPLVHLAARLMRIDQELACDEAVVSRFPGARRAYAEVLVKAQLAILPLPLGCYWPSAAAHPLVERVAMLRRRGVGGARRLAGLVALVVLGFGAGLAAWASQPVDVRIAIRPAGDVRPTLARGVAAMRGRMRTADDVRVRTANQATLAPKRDESVAADDLAAPPTAVAPTDVSPLGAAPAGAVPAPPVHDIAQAQAPPAAVAPEVGRLQPADLQSRQPAAQDASAALSQPARQHPDTQGAAAAKIETARYAGLPEDPDQEVCKLQAVTGSRFIRRVCMSRMEWTQQQRRLFDFERMLLLDPSGASELSF